MADKGYPTHKIKPSNNKLEFRIEEIAFNNHYNVNDPHAHDYYEIFLFETGGGTHTIDFIETPIQPKSIHLVIPGQVHTVGREGSCTGMVMVFSKAYLEGSSILTNMINSFPFVRSNSKPYIKEIEEHNFKFIFDIVTKVFDENANTGFNAKQIIQSYLNIVLLKTQEIFNDQAQEISPIVNTALLYIEKNISHSLRPADVATVLKTSTDSLNAQFKKELGLTIKALIKDLLLRVLKRALLLNNQSLKEIAYNYDFSDPSYFTKYIKKELGCTPNEFRDKFAS